MVHSSASNGWADRPLQSPKRAVWQPNKGRPGGLLAAGATAAVYMDIVTLTAMVQLLYTVKVVHTRSYKPRHTYESSAFPLNRLPTESNHSHSASQGFTAPDHRSAASSRATSSSLWLKPKPSRT
jgi:hypothetical protein